jgi:hypothetical protein
MFGKSIAASVIVISFLCISFSTPASATPTGPLQNGDFSKPDLFGWTVSPTGSVIDDSGQALFNEYGTDVTSSLTQLFTIPAGASNLSFELGLPGMGGPNCDVFTASLFKPGTSVPLISRSGSFDFYYWEARGASGEEQKADEVILTENNGKRLVILNVSSLTNNGDVDVLLTFGLLSTDDGINTSIPLDNVTVSPIPAPSAALLGGIGIGSIAWLRRRRAL